MVGPVAILALLGSFLTLGAVGSPLAAAAITPYVSAGGLSTCFLQSVGAVQCWGENQYGQLGDGTYTASVQPMAVAGLPPATTIAAGDEVTCAIATASAAWCWGRDNYGQLGNASTAPRLNKPVQVAGGLAFKQLSVKGDVFACGLTVAEQVYCWGHNSDGELGDGTTTDSDVPVAVSLARGSVVQIAAGDEHACALLSTGAVWCWGDNSDGQLGDGTTVSSHKPVQVMGLSGVDAIAAGKSDTCAIAGTSEGLYCWGLNNAFQLGDGTNTNRTTPVPVAGLSSGVEQVSAGFEQTCAIVVVASMQAECWGANGYGQVGGGSLSTAVKTPTVVFGLATNPASGLGGAEQISAGGWHTCAVLNIGPVECWGRNNMGQIGDGTQGNRDLPTLVMGLYAGPQAVSEGWAGGCALEQSLEVRCWGTDDGTNFDPQTSAVPVLDLGSRTAQVAAGTNDVCALATAGSLRCWGYNLNGEDGVGDTDQHPTPQPVMDMSSGVLSVTEGDGVTCSIKTGYDPFCWGENQYGALGDSSTSNSDVPKHVGLGVTQISAEGLEHTCAISTSGAAYCWGSDMYGELGDGSTTNDASPQQVQGLPAPAVQIATGGTFDASVHPVGFTCALLTTGDVYCWGYDADGELGDGTTNTTPNTAPVRVELSGPAGQVVAALAHACALLDTGAVECWGDDSVGELGNGGTVSSDTPITVFGLASSAISLSSDDAPATCAVIYVPAEVECWGDNLSDELGDGSTASFSNTPQIVQGL